MRAFVLLLVATAWAPALAQTTEVRPVKGPPVPGSEAPRETLPRTETIMADRAESDPATTLRSTLKPADAPGDGTQPRQRLVTVFGNEACPKPSSPDEVVVCARLPESEIYRIPTQLRQADRRNSPFEENRALLVGDVAGGGIGSCSAVGAGGAVGCNRRQVDAWASDRAGRMGTEEEIPRQ